MAVEKETPQNPLLSKQKASDSGLQVALHPLVLLTISDYITRHTLRQQKGPVVGALLGQQNGREITIEHAFDCHLIEVDGEVILSQVWFEDRLQQMKDVHKVPALDLVGWFTIIPTSGPLPIHLPIHRQILQSYNESAILLGFHPEDVLNRSIGGKLPLSIYESNYEAEETTTDAGEDKEMKDAEPKLGLKFKELPYTVETGEAEMIGVDFVARGGGNATAVDGAQKKGGPAALGHEDPKGKGKVRVVARKPEEQETPVSKAEAGQFLSREDEELIASLTAKANAIKMLKARVDLIAVYLRKLPPSYVSGSVVEEGVKSDDEEYAPVSHEVLRSIQALLTRLGLLIPADSAAFEKELLSEENDVNMVSMLSTITNSIKDVRETGRKFSVVQLGMMKAKGAHAMWNDGPSSGVSGAGDLISS
ncbi:Uncharacterized protein BP5553_06780 [Venustampulla echinocandica]|uniref:COP9 signalosome complex subunit 6 n=1 Tax=Venustampulla echinocandica TaxID=2656787 RepID=A0A370TKW7_9HELO|nr:Uncharacterized protein BP5553_06780 [Venustampulla echinocandica]RDL36168.1 Uncharacterized protein BP5553_06780 [Venustampulla echinocandica]